MRKLILATFLALLTPGKSIPNAPRLHFAAVHGKPHTQ